MLFLLFLALAARATAAPAGASTAIIDRVINAADVDAASGDDSAFNANYNYGKDPLNYCLRGMPENVWDPDDGATVKTYNDAHELLDYWTELARQTPGNCINRTASSEEEFNGEATGGLDVSNKYKLAFREVAKIASNTMNAYMNCRFDLPTGQKCDGSCVVGSDYKKVTMWRNPTLRGVSGLFQMMMHYLTFIKLPPDLMRQCLDKWPDEKQRLSLSTLKNMPTFCYDAWTKNAFKPDDPEHVAPFDKYMMEQTVDSALLAALWKLPGGCRTLSKGDSTNNPPQNWFCGDKYNPDCDSNAECTLDRKGMAGLLIAALSDLARTTSMGCGGKTWANEHMSTIFISTAFMAEVDAVMKLEKVSEHQLKLENFIEETAGKKLPEPSEGCSFDAIHGNEGVENHGLNPKLENHDLITDTYTASADLQQRLCVYYYQDYLCGAYEMLPACKADPKTWMKDAMDRLVSGTPVTDL